MKKAFAALLALAAVAAHASGLEALENFVKTARSGRAEFTQTVTSPGKNGQVRTKTSTGTFEFQRPDRFRFAYRKPFEQVIVADGKIVSRELLSEAINRGGGDGDPRSVDALVSRLRRKLVAHDEGAELIVTAAGFGYRLGCAVQAV